jgi:hypothetical protein
VSTLYAPVLKILSFKWKIEEKAKRDAQPLNYTTDYLQNQLLNEKCLFITKLRKSLEAKRKISKSKREISSKLGGKN